jgi:hypothetical protein
MTIEESLVYKMTSRTAIAATSAQVAKVVNETEIK